tara:strand:+ start:2389 stop:4680 length:2292 start_codon:yes stop_codon:yes gene_type:complete
MAMVTVEIPGIGEVEAKNAASEQTLKEILKAVGGRRIGAGAGGSAGGGLDSRLSDKDVKNVKALGDASEYASGEVTSFGKRLKGVAGSILNLLNATISGTIGAAVNLTSELISGGNQLTDFSKHLPIPGLQQFTGLIDNQIELFRDLSQTGATFGNNMFEIVRVAGNASIPLQDFATLLGSNATQLRLFGPSVESGARSFASLSKELRQGQLGQRLLAMGFTTQELNEGLLSFNEIVHVTGRGQRMSQADLIKGTAAYSMELDKIAKLTGQSRKEMMNEAQARRRDVNVQNALRRLGPEFENVLNQASAGSKGLAAALVDYSTGTGQDPLTQGLMALSDTFRNEGKNIQNMTAEQRQNFAVAVGKEIEEMENTVGPSGVKALTMQGELIGEALNVGAELRFLKQTTEGASSAVDKEQKAVDMATEKVAQFGEVVNNVRGRLQVELLDSNIFQDLKNGLASMLPNVEESNDLYDKAKKALLPFIDELNNVWTWLKTEGYDMMENAFKKTWDWMSGPGLQMVKDYSKMAYDWFSGIDFEGIKNDFLAGWEKVKKFFAGFDLDAIKLKFDNAMKKLENMMPDIPSIDEIKTSMKAALKKLTDAIPGPQDIKDALTDLKNEFVQDMKELIDYLFTQLRKVVDEYLVNPAKAVIEKGEEIVQDTKDLAIETKDKVVSGVGALKDKAGETYQNTKNAVKNFLGFGDKDPVVPPPTGMSPGAMGGKVNTTPDDGALQLNITMEKQLKVLTDIDRHVKENGRYGNLLDGIN